jgi:hypothetical protein
MDATIAFVAPTLGRATNGAYSYILSGAGACLHFAMIMGPKLVPRIATLGHPTGLYIRHSARCPDVGLSGASYRYNNFGFGFLPRYVGLER